MKLDTALPIADALKSALEAFRSGDFGQAEVEAEAALSMDYEHPEVQAALKCAIFWKDRVVRAESLPAPETKGDYYLKEWQGFDQRFRAHLDVPYEQGVEAIKGVILERSAQLYCDQLAYEEDGRKPDLLIKAAKAWKSAGAYDRALEVLDQVLTVRPDDAGTLAEMADCFEAVGSIDKSRLFFREAFYWNAQGIDLSGLRSGVIRQLVSDLEEEGLSGAALKEWLPVHAVIRGVFTVKRDLKALELGQLRQGIGSMKAELHGSQEGNLVLPRLLYRYFWLIDHYLSVKEERSKIEDVLLNIKLLDEKIYELYTH